MGLVADGSIWLGGDSAAVTDDMTRIPVVAPKVFRRGGVVLGYSGSFRAGHLIEHALKVPDMRRGDTLDRWLHVDVMAALGQILHGTDTDDLDFLLGIEGRLFHVDGEFHVTESRYGFDAVGCGAPFALGAIASTATWHDPRSRVTQALEVAAQFCAGVCGPYTIVEGRS